jgi:hypothetical protein
MEAATTATGTEAPTELAETGSEAAAGSQPVAQDAAEERDESGRHLSREAALDCRRAQRRRA